MCTSIKGIVTDYKKKSFLRQSLDACKTLEDCVNGMKPVCVGCNSSKGSCTPTIMAFNVVFVKGVHPHQRRISKTKLCAFLNAMRGLNFNQTFNDFDEFFEFVAANSGLVNGHCLLVYDFCLRKGYQLGIEPKKWVYLFRGAKEGAQYVLGKLSPSTYKVPTATLQNAIDPSLSSMEIEDLLCTYKTQLGKIFSKTPTTHKSTLIKKQKSSKP